MNSATLSPLPDQRHGRLMLVLIITLLALPFAIGAGLYFGGWQPSRISHHGRLLDPPQMLPGSMLRASGNSGEKWILLFQVHGPCTAECAARLDEMRRIHVALYKNMGRLNRAVLTDQPDDPALLALRDSQPDLLLLSAPPGEPAMPSDPLLLVDPQGQMIMGYPPGASPNGVRTDLERLLRYAWTG